MRPLAPLLFVLAASTRLIAADSPECRHPDRDGVRCVRSDNASPAEQSDPASPAPTYVDRFDLVRVISSDGTSRQAKTPAEWEPRRRHIVAAMERVMGPLPNPAKRVPLDVNVLEEITLEGGLVRRKLNYQTDATGRVTAYLFIPRRPAADSQPPPKRPAILCLHQTTAAGKSEPAGLAGDGSLHYALHLARRGYVTLAPDYPSFGDSTYDFAARHGYASGSMKAVWDNVRAVDLLATLAEVDAARLGIIGHSLGGHNAMFTAVFEPRLRVIVSSCGFTTFRKDDMPSWTGPRYMPRIATEFGNDAAKLPFDFAEIVAAFAPRPFLACAAENDDDFDVSGVRDVLVAARSVYNLHGASESLAGFYPKSPHSFPEAARRVAYEFLDKHLQAAP